MADIWEAVVTPLRPTPVLRLSQWAPARIEPADRVTLVSQWVLPEEKARAAELLRVLESLRESLLLTRDDAEYCFSQLPRTSPNRKLREYLLRYLDSPLCDDLTASAWRIVDSLGTGSLPSPFPDGVTLVPAFQPSAIFLELARALSRTGQENEIRLAEPWEALTPDLPERASHSLEGSAPRIGVAAATRAATLRRRNLAVALGLSLGSAGREALRLRLLSLGLRAEITPSHESSPLIPRSAAEWVARARRAPELANADRLRLAALLGEWISREQLQPGDELCVEKLLASGWLDPSDHKRIETLSPMDTESPSSANPLPALPSSVPFPLPRLAGLAPVVALDKSWERPEAGAFLSVEDSLRLRAAGFPVPAPDSRAERRQRYETAWISGEAARTRLFCTQGLIGRIGRSRRMAQRSISQGARATRAPAAPKRLSATQLESYAICPARYFFASRLRLRPRGAQWDDRFALWLGIATHRCLDEWLGSRKRDFFDLLPASSSDALEAEAMPFFRSALDAEGVPDEPAARMALEIAFSRLLKNLPAIEAHLDRVFGRREIAARELPFTVDIEGLAVTGSIDRVDKVSDEYLVLDYKTGQVGFTPAHVSEGSHFQAPLYLLAAQRLLGRVRAVLFYDLKEGEARRGLIREAALSGAEAKAFTRGHVLSELALQTILSEGLAQAREAAKRMSEGDFAPRPSAEACGPCDMGPLCGQRLGHV